MVFDHKGRNPSLFTIWFKTNKNFINIFLWKTITLTTISAAHTWMALDTSEHLAASVNFQENVVEECNDHKSSPWSEIWDRNNSRWKPCPYFHMGTICCSLDRREQKFEPICCSIFWSWLNYWLPATRWASAPKLISNYKGWGWKYSPTWLQGW